MMPSATTTAPKRRSPSGLRRHSLYSSVLVFCGIVCAIERRVCFMAGPALVPCCVSASLGLALSERPCEGRACVAQVFSISVLAQLDDAGLSALGVRAMAARARIQAAARGLCAIVDGVRQVRPRAHQFDAFSASVAPPHPLFPRNVKLSILLEYSLLPLLRYRGSAPLGINKN